MGAAAAAEGGGRVVESDEAKGAAEFAWPEVNRYRSVAGTHGASYDAALDATGKFVVSAGEDQQLHIYAVASGKHSRCYRANPTPDASAASASSSAAAVAASGGLYRVDVSPGGVLAATCSFDRWIRVLDFYSGRVVAAVRFYCEAWYHRQNH